jgi:hypothetical protein
VFIDMHVNPAFYEPINQDEELEEMRHEVLNIHLNGTALLEHIFNQMNCAGLDRLCLLPDDYTSETGRPVVTNEEVKKLADMAPDKFIAFAGVDPFDEKAEGKLEYAFSELHLKGLKLHPSRQKFYPYEEKVQPLYDICEKYNKPVIFSSGLSWEPNTLAKYSRPIEFEELAAKRPGLKFSLGQFGWPWVKETAMLLLKYPNVYADTGVLYFDNAREFYRQIFTVDIPYTWIDRSLRHQVMFGSSNPRFEQIRMAAAIEELGFREETLELIKGKNAIEFLGGI